MTTYVVIGGGVSGLAAARVLAGGRRVAGVGSGGGGGLGEAGVGSGGGGLGEAGVGSGGGGLGEAGGVSSGGGTDDGGRGTPAPAHVIVLEASDQLGGKVRSARLDGEPVEIGPDQFLRRDPSAELLCRHLGLGDDLVPPSALSAAVFSHGRPRQLPAGLVLGVPTDLDALAASGIVGADALEYASHDSERPGEPLESADVGLDTSVDIGRERSAGEVLRPRLGDEIVDRLVDPLIGGINAGAIDRLSLGTVAPQIARALVGHPDVIAPLAAVAPATGAGGGQSFGTHTSQKGDHPPGQETTDPGGGQSFGTHTSQKGDHARLNPPPPASPSPFLGLVGGLARMIERLECELRDLDCEIRLGCTVRGVTREGPGFLIDTPAGQIRADGVVIAVPAAAAARLLHDVAPEGAQALSGIVYSSVAVVTYAFPAGSVASVEHWSGVLVPRVEGALMTAVTFLSSKWPWMAQSGRPLLRVSAGRHLDERIAGLDDGQLAKHLAVDLERLTGIDASRATPHVHRWAQAFPQYTPGHAARITRLRRALAESPGIQLAGATLGGIGIPACITSGEQAASAVLAATAAGR